MQATADARAAAEQAIARLAARTREHDQAVQDERRACADIVDAQMQRERGWGNDDAASVLQDVRNLILFRSRSTASHTPE